MTSKDYHNVHLIGASGSGMKPLAEIAISQGYKVSGSDQQASASLSQLGATISVGHQGQNIPNDCHLIVYSSAISPSNPEILEGQRRGIPVIHRSEFLRILAGEKKIIAVTGTHGKTSTTALIAHTLTFLGMEPTACIGGEILGADRSSYIGEGDYFVAELDESDGSFLNFHPYISVINNIDLDHLNFYRDLEHIKETFIQFCQQTDPDGGLIFGWDNSHSQEIGIKFEDYNRLTFGSRIGSDVRGLTFKASDKGSQFTAMVEREKISGNTPCFGSHNFQNILGCLAVIHILELDLQKAGEALASFKGVKRRLNCLYSSKNLKVFDDYAHNPGKIMAVIEALRTTFPDWHLSVIFQPHRYTRMVTMYEEFASSFSLADDVYVTEVFAAGEPCDASYDKMKFCEDVERLSHTSCSHLNDHASADSLLDRKRALKPTVILTVGAGDVYKLSQQLRTLALEEETTRERKS